MLQVTGLVAFQAQYEKLDHFPRAGIDRAIVDRACFPDCRACEKPNKKHHTLPYEEMLIFSWFHDDKPWRCRVNLVQCFVDNCRQSAIKFNRLSTVKILVDTSPIVFPTYFIPASSPKCSLTTIISGLVYGVHQQNYTTIATWFNIIYCNVWAVKISKYRYSSTSFFPSCQISCLYYVKRIWQQKL